MNQKALAALEYSKILDILEGFAVSSRGKALARKIEPSAEYDEVIARQAETEAAAMMSARYGRLPLGGIQDISDIISRAEMGGALNIAELSAAADFVYADRKAARYAAQDSKRARDPVLDPLFDLLRPAEPLEREIERCIINRAEIADSASAKLGEIRRGLRTAGDRVKTQLNEIIRSGAYKNMLQDAVVTIRSGRYCVPVRQEHRNDFPGLVHDQSGTGQTLFIEPAAVVRLNNRVKELLAEEAAETDKILARLSGLVAEESEQLKADLETLTKLDVIFAKGEMALSQNAVRPAFNDRGEIFLKKARHPLLPKDGCVPVDVWLGREFTVLLITGPNTGGKTVCLKTLGLLTLMGQAGFHIPAGDGSELAVFGGVFADIGDEQSIEQSLSTFSGHMRNIVAILAAAPRNSLVLLDELGAGTDPVEGAAIAAAIVDELRRRGVRAAVTTHYSELKVYAVSTEGAENAACEFDVATLKPTYRLLIGVPGKSNAFAVSGRLGLPAEIISRAKALLTESDERFEDVITNLEISKKTAEIERSRAEEYRREAELAKKEMERQREKLSESREKILAEARREARAVLDGAKAEADLIIKEMRRGGAEREQEERRRRLREKTAGLDETPEYAPVPAFKPITNLKQGDRIFSHTLNRPGIVLAMPGAGGEVIVQVGEMKLKVPVNTLSAGEAAPSAPKPRAAHPGFGKGLDISPKIDLRGCLAQEAVEKLDKYLDDAYLAGIGKAEIIHGKGTGALRAAVGRFLKGHRYVKSHRLGVFGEGDDGVTIVELA
jgi:DNA mismatch repair protein MutS2